MSYGTRRSKELLITMTLRALQDPPKPGRAKTGAVCIKSHEVVTNVFNFGAEDHFPD